MFLSTTDLYCSHFLYTFRAFRVKNSLTPSQFMHAFSPFPLNSPGQAAPHSQTFQPLLLHRALKLGCSPPTDPHIRTHIRTGTHGYRHTDSSQQVSQIKSGTEALVFPGLSEWLPLNRAHFTSLHHLHHLSAPAALTSPKQDLTEPLGFIGSPVETWRICGNLRCISK